MPTPARTRQAALAMLAALTLSSVAACSSAPAPAALEQEGATADSSAAGPTGAAVPGAPAAAATGVPIAPGVTVSTRPDGTVVTTTTKNGKTVTTVSKPGGGGGGTTGGTAAVARSRLFTPAEDKIGITPTSITMCAHAALTYGAAFNTSDADLNVFWSAVNDNGGIFGRKVSVTYENDDYKPTTAVTAARACKAKGIFMLLGGIGFDQIPAVRNWAEENRMLYMHHTATVKGTAGKKFSFAPLPTVERTGEAFAQLYISKYKGKKVGIIKRDGENWEPGVDAFKAYIGSHGGGKVVAEAAVPQNKGDYTQDILKMRNAGAEVVWVWENALCATQIVKQIKAQNYKPNMMLFPFNLTAQTLGDDAMDPVLDGVAMFTAYSRGDYGGPFASYQDDIKLFEQQYKKYRPNVDLGGVGGDLLFLNWTAQKSLYEQFLECGKDCTRNRFVDVLESYNKRPTSSVCPVDFTGGSHRSGSDKLVFMETYRAPGGKVNWRNTKMCVGAS